ncbi:MAG TPA: type II secretion system protein GspM [Rhodocyclaceae bacterium]|nr:type II secretion system protein GspM [Rhodocyclaceae bacterium]
MATQLPPLSPLTRAQQYWAERNPRERRLILIAALVVSVGLLWTLHDWQATERTRLDRLLPTVQAQVKAMQDDAAELARLRSLTRAPHPDAGRDIEALQGSATAQNLPLSIRSEGDNILVSGTALPFDAWIIWLAGAQNTQRLKVQTMEVTREANGLHIEARLAQSQ